MAGGWTHDGGVLDQIEDTVTNGVLSARARLPAGESLLFCVECGEDIYGIARGVDDRPVNPDRERKSSGSETTFETNLLDTTRIETEIAALAEKVFAWCQKAHAYGRTATVKIKYADFAQATRHWSLAAPISDAATLRLLAQDLVRSVYPLRTGVRLLGVTVSSFASAPPSVQAALPV